MKGCCRIIFVCCAVAVGLSARAGDPYDYKELTTTASHPIEVRKGLFDFGKDGIGADRMERADKRGSGRSA